MTISTANKAPFQKSIWRKIFLFFAIVVTTTLLVFGIPLLINELYKINDGYLTLWSAADVLAYYSEILGGVISIGALIATIYYTKKDTDKQIRFSQSQYNVPFFIIDLVYQSEDHKNFTKSDDGVTWQKKISISRQQTGQKEIIIALKNIGEGIAIAPIYEIDSLPLPSANNPIYIATGEKFVLKYNPYKVLEKKFGAHFLPDKSQSFDVCITLYYQNVSGISYTQDINLLHNCDIERNSLEIMISDIFPQKVKF